MSVLSVVFSLFSLDLYDVLDSVFAACSDNSLLHNVRFVSFISIHIHQQTVGK